MSLLSIVEAAASLPSAEASAACVAFAAPEDVYKRQLHHLCGKAHHRQTTVQDDVQKRTNDDILKTYLRTTGNRHTAQYQCNQDLGLKLVTTGRSNRTNLDNIDKCGKSCDRTCQCVDKELHAVGTDAGEHRCFLTCSDRL